MVRAAYAQVQGIKQLWKLPEGWEWVLLGDAFSIRSGTLEPTKKPNERFCLYSIPAYDAGIGPELQYGREIGSSKVIVQRGDILLSKLNPRIPRVWQVDLESPYSKLASTEFLPLVGQLTAQGIPHFDTTFIKMLLLSDIFRQQVAQDVQGATGSRQRLKRETVLAALLPRPCSLETQRRIAARIETLMAEVKRARTLLEHIRRNTDIMLKAALAEVIAKLDSRSPESPTLYALLSNERLTITGGGTPSTGNKHYWNGAIPWVSPKDMKSWYIDDTQDHISPVALEETAVKLVPKGSVLVVVRGMILAHTFPVGVTTKEVTINQDMKAFSPADDLLPEYLAYILRARASSILREVEIAAHGTRRLKTDTLMQVVVPDIPKDSQQRIVTYLDSIQSAVNDMQRILDQDAKLLDQLEQSILQRAFRGEL